MTAAAPGSRPPTITIPKTAAPKTLQVKTLIKGTGRGREEGPVDSSVQYTGRDLADRKVLRLLVVAQRASAFTTIGEGQVITGWDTGLVGQTVGSRVLLVIPPADGYGTTGALAPAGIKGTDTLVFVVDILAADVHSAPASTDPVTPRLSGDRRRSPAPARTCQPPRGRPPCRPVMSRGRRAQGGRVPPGRGRGQEVLAVLVQGAAHGGQRDRAGAQRLG